MKLLQNFKNLYLIYFIVLINVLCSQKLLAQNNWEIGIGGGITVFKDDDVKFIGDKDISQIPRFDITRLINNRLSINVAVSFGAADSNINFLTTNNISYLSIDFSGRYIFFKQINKLDPYIFIGGSIIDSNYGISPTTNLGGGVNYWLLNNFGINSNAYYKYSLNKDNLRSHFQFTLGLVLSINFRGNLYRNSYPSSCF